MAAFFQVVFLGPWILKTRSKKMGILMYKPNAKDLDFMTELFEAGKVAPVLDRRYPLFE
jgi:NADPH:quinone reductase-like Zn-dependent oxidoreductase